MKDLNSYNRRDFMRMAGIAGAAALVAPGFAFAAAKKKHFKIGATFILWGYGSNALEPALQDIASLGYHSFETFGNVMDDYEKKPGGFKEVVQKYNVPIVSAFCTHDVLDPAKTTAEVEKLRRWSKILKANGGKVIEFCAGGRRGAGFDYKNYKKSMVDSMNLYGKVAQEEGMICALHPHTGTPVETQEEIYIIMENMDSRYIKIGTKVVKIKKNGHPTLHKTIFLGGKEI